MVYSKPINYWIYRGVNIVVTDKIQIIKNAVEQMELDVNEYQLYYGLIVKEELLHLIKFIENLEGE